MLREMQRQKTIEKTKKQAFHSRGSLPAQDVKLQLDVPQEEEDDDDWGLALPAVMTACCRSDWMKSVTLARRRGASVSATANTVDGRRFCGSSGPRSKRKTNTGKTCF